MYLFFDISANGIPKKWNGDPQDVFNWPRMFHLSWLYYDEERNLISSSNDKIKPKGFSIDKKYEKINKVDIEDLKENGVDAKEALTKFAQVIKEAKYVIAFNMSFMKGIAASEFKRANVNSLLLHSDLYCLKQEATWFCKIQDNRNKNKYKKPTLQEIHAILYGAQYANPGDAEVDVSTIAVCTFNLLDLEAMEFF